MNFDGILRKLFKVLQNSGIPQDLEPARFGILQKLLLSFLEILEFLSTQSSVVHRGLWIFSINHFESELQIVDMLLSVALQIDNLSYQEIFLDKYKFHTDNGKGTIHVLFLDAQKPVLIKGICTIIDQTDVNFSVVSKNMVPSLN